MKYVKVLNCWFGGKWTPTTIFINFDNGVLEAFLTYLHETWHWVFYKVKYSIPSPENGYSELGYPLLFRFLDFLSGILHPDLMVLQRYVSRFHRNLKEMKGTQ